MKHLPAIAGALLGLLFLVASVPVLLHMPMPEPKIPEGSPNDHFMRAFGPTGYFMFVKACECLGGILVAIPRTRNFGLLILGPIIVNILAYLTFVQQGLGDQPAVPAVMVTMIVVLALYLLWADRRAFAGLAGGTKAGAAGE